MTCRIGQMPELVVTMEIMGKCENDVERFVWFVWPLDDDETLCGSRWVVWRRARDGHCRIINTPSGQTSRMQGNQVA